MYPDLRENQEMQMPQRMEMSTAAGDFQIYSDAMIPSGPLPTPILLGDINA
jgi:hypothetical protein